MFPWSVDSLRKRKQLPSTSTPPTYADPFGLRRPRITTVLHQTSYLVAPTLHARASATTSSLTDEVNRLAYAPITPAVRKRTSIRLLETLQFVLDIMGSPLPLRTSSPSAEKEETWEEKNRWRVGRNALQPIHGEGWKSVVRVRLLHGIVRRRVMKTVESGGKGGYDFETGELACSSDCEMVEGS